MPNLVGSSLLDARRQLSRIGISPKVAFAAGLPGTVVRQVPEAGVAAGPRLEVKLVVGRGMSTASS